MLLEDENWVVGAAGDHIEERIKSESVIRCDPAIVNKEKDSQHIDFVWNDAPAPPYIVYTAGED